jgi:hypothetical protein
MPSRASLDGSPAVGTTLLKRHKILPHPRTDRHTDTFNYVPISRPRDLTIDTGVPSITSSSDTSSPPTLKHAFKRIGAPVLPPTPPAHSRQSSEIYSTITSGPKSNFDTNSVPGTPVTHNSPPTPDVTPPRTKPPLAFRPAADRYPSSNSRTDSFKTARETPYSSDDDEVSTVRPKLPSARPSDNETQRIPNKGPKRKEVGLGLGLESDEGSRTPRPNTDSQPEFVVFDGEWGSTEEFYEVEREWDDNLMRNVTVRKRPGRKPYNFTDGPEVLEDDIVSPTAATKVVRSLPLQERIARHRLEREEKKFRESIGWAPAEPEALSTPDLRRFSAMSGRSVSSTIIEALVVDAPTMGRKTLRHTKKYNGLRDFSDRSARGSAPSSDISSEPHHKPTPRTSRIPDRRHRSLASNTTASTVTSRSSSGKSRHQVLKSGGIPVVVIPDRQSSTRSSREPSLRSTSSKRTKRTLSLSSAPLSQSSKFNDPAFSQPLPRKRTMSESAGSRHSERTIDFPPDIPVRRSSLSAPTSRNTSRAGSLTAESLKAHNMMHLTNQTELKREVVPLQRSLGSQKEFSQSPRLSVDHNGDPFFGNRQSTQVTPFSQVSYETAGTMAEVSEAMAVAIFPHQNTSVLMVQQPGAAPQPSSSKLLAPQPQITVNDIGPITPPQPVHPMDEVDSPLRNPREPPVPPAIKFIPPTPAGLSPGEGEEKQLGYVEDERPDSSDSRTKRGMSLMRRAFSNRRRNSEPVITGSGVGLIKRTLSLTGRRKQYVDDSIPKSSGNGVSSNLYPTVEDRPADMSKLHPFWRPAHFWDDLEDHDSADDDEFGRYPIIDNRPAPPKRNLSNQLKRTFAILPIKDDDSYYEPQTMDRRALTRSDSGKMRVTKQRSNSSLRREMNERRRYIEDRTPPEERFGYGFKEGNGGRMHTIPGLGIRVEYVGWSNMKRRLSERRRQERSEKLRGSISNPRAVQNGVDDVLRRKS